MVACPPLMSPEINGEACRVEPVEVDPGGASKTSPVSISFEVGDHTQPDLPSSSIDAKYYYAPWQPLQQQFPISHLSKSCQEIVTSSSGITTRSASASAILDVNQDMTEMEQESAVTPKYHHKSEVPHSLVMQVSFDHLLSAPPAGRRRKSGQQQFLINHLSRSCQEVATSTSGSMTRSLSSSAGDISNMVTHDTKETQQESGVTSKRRHRSEVHRPLVMQASLDHLSAPPVGKRRRRFADERRSVQQEQAPQQTHLRVRGIVRNIRKSLGDLLKTEEH